MNGNRWFICADESKMQLLVQGLRKRYPEALIQCDSDAGYIRNRLLKDIPGASSVLVGEGCMTLEPINLAAALVHDGHAREVVLVMQNISGSLRSRASRAGITHVLDESEFRDLLSFERNWADGGTTAKLLEKQTALEAATHLHASDSEDTLNRLYSTATSQHSDFAGYDVHTSRFDVEKTYNKSSEQFHGAEELDEIDDLQKRVERPCHIEHDGHAHPKMPALIKSLGLESQHPLSAYPVPPLVHAPLICFASGRGGVGKTTMSVISACLASQWGLRCALIDLDLSFGNAFAMLGQAHPTDISMLGQASENFRESCASAARQVREGLSLWGPCERPEMAETVVPHIAQFISEVSSGVDLIICDTSSDWGDELACAVQLADRLVLVSDERQRSFASLTRAAALAVRLGVARTRIVRLTNHCEQKGKSDPSFLRAAVGLETARNYEIEDGGDELRELMSLGHADKLASSNSAFTQSVASFLAHTLQELGKLPDSQAAKAALEQRKSGRMWSLFGLKREAV